MRKLRFALWILVVVGLIAFVVSAYGALLDWPELRRAYEHWRRVAESDGDMRALFIAEARQNIHRVNLFADVVWALLGLIICALATIGLCVLQSEKHSP